MFTRRAQSAMIMLMATDEPVRTNVNPKGIIRRRQPRGLIIVVVTIAVLIIVGAMAYLVLYRSGDHTVTHNDMTDSQLRDYQQALSFAETSKGLDPTTHAMQLVGAGGLMDRAGQYQESLDYYLQAQKVVQDNNLTKTSAMNYSEQIADEYVKLGNKTKARHYYDNAIAFAKTQTRNPDLAKSVKALELKKDKL